MSDRGAMGVAAAVALCTFACGADSAAPEGSTASTPDGAPSSADDAGRPTPMAPQAEAGARTIDAGTPSVDAGAPLHPDAGMPACAVLLHSTGFESGTYLDTFQQPNGNTGGVKVVSNAEGAGCITGDKCLRGNFLAGYVDPITGMAATSHLSGLQLGLGGVVGFYLRLHFKLDTGDRWIMNDGKDTVLGYKFFYLMGTPWNNTLNWVLGNSWSATAWNLVDNQPKDSTNYDFGVHATGAQGQLGAWHLLEMGAVMNSAVGAKDGRFQFKIDGASVIDVSDVPWQTSTAQKFDILGGVPHMFGGCCEPLYPFGWEEDDVELWELPPGCAIP